MGGSLLMPQLVETTLCNIPVLTDPALHESCGVRIAFTGRAGGVSQAPYDALNLGSHVGDKLSDVQANREMLLEAIASADAQLLVPNQVHGTRIEVVSSAQPADVESAACSIAQGCDGIVVEVPKVAALLCYADCTPVVIVSPEGLFAVLHAGWRGAVAGIVGKAVDQLATKCDPAELNVYIGPHICEKCFETGIDVSQQFVEAFGTACVPDERHVSLTKAIICDALAHGIHPKRVVDVGLCTMCNPQRYYSYRQSKGVCGRHGAIAIRE